MLPDPVECENGGKRTFLQINGSRKRTTENVFTPVLARGIRELRAGKFFPRRMRFGVKFWGMIIVSGSVVSPIRRLTVLGGWGWRFGVCWHSSVLCSVDRSLFLIHGTSRGFSPKIGESFIPSHRIKKYIRTSPREAYFVVYVSNWNFFLWESQLQIIWRRREPQVRILV